MTAMLSHLAASSPRKGAIEVYLYNSDKHVKDSKKIVMDALIVCIDHFYNQAKPCFQFDLTDVTVISYSLYLDIAPGIRWPPHGGAHT